jgi:hypothetical protein
MGKPADHVDTGFDSGVGSSPTVDIVDVATSSSLTSPSLVRTFATQVSAVTSDSFGQSFSFRSWPEIQPFKSAFASTVLTSVTIHVVQSHLVATEQSTARVFKFGIVPANVTGVQGEDLKKISNAHMIPHLRFFSTTIFNSNSLSTTWGDGGIPFPPGMQLELNVTELCFKYPRAIICNLLPNTDKHIVLQWFIEATFTFTGRNF